jgi:hypothetical protein
LGGIMGMAGQPPFELEGRAIDGAIINKDKFNRLMPLGILQNRIDGVGETILFVINWQNHRKSNDGRALEQEGALVNGLRGPRIFAMIFVMIVAPPRSPALCKLTHRMIH